MISLAGIVYAKSVRVGGDKLDEALVQHLKRKYNLLVGERTAEQIKIEVGSAYPGEDDQNASIEVKGRDLVTGIPKTLNIDASEVALPESNAATMVPAAISYNFV